MLLRGTLRWVRPLVVGTRCVKGMVAYLDDTDDVLKYDGTAWTTVRNAGIGSNVVQTVTTTRSQRSHHDVYLLSQA
jgi:hypothetical protein